MDLAKSKLTQVRGMSSSCPSTRVKIPFWSRFLWLFWSGSRLLKNLQKWPLNLNFCIGSVVKIILKHSYPFQTGTIIRSKQGGLWKFSKFITIQLYSIFYCCKTALTLGMRLPTNFVSGTDWFVNSTLIYFMLWNCQNAYRFRISHTAVRVLFPA